jgi:alpha-L-rhamnosidase
MKHRRKSHPPLSTQLFVSLLLLLATPFAQAQVSLPTVDPAYALGNTEELKKSDQPQWIWSQRSKNAQTILLRKAIPVSGKVKSASLHITADDSFSLYLNGSAIDHSDLNPDGTSSWAKAHAVDLTRTLLSNQTNAFAVIAENVTGSSGLVFRLDWTDDAGDHTLVSDRSWKVLADAPADLVQSSDWKQTGFDDQNWEAATVVAPLSGDPWRAKGGLQNWPGYEASDTFYLSHLRVLPVSVKINNGDASNFQNIDSLVHPLADGSQNLKVIFTPGAAAKDNPSLILDFGKELVGGLVIRSSDDGATIAFSPGESEAEAQQDPWTEEDKHPVTLKKDELVHSVKTGFRYMVINFTPPKSGEQENHFNSISADHIYYPVTYRGSFESSDATLNKIWYTGAYTTHLCMQEDIWDAPKRDHKRWMGDMMISGDVINNVFGDRFLMEQAFSRIRSEAQATDDETALPVKHIDNGSPYSNAGVPGYSYAWISQLASFQRHSGDFTYLLRQHDLLVSMLQFIETDLDKDGIFTNAHKGWNFVDWSPKFGKKDSKEARLETNLFLVKALDDAVFLLREMKDTANAEVYTALATREREVVRAKFQDTRDSTFGKRRQNNAMAVFAGITQGDEAESIFQQSLKPGTADWKNVMTPYFMNYVIYAQSMSGHTQEAVDYIKSYWGGMLDLGTTTWFERFDLSWPKVDFHSHMPVKAHGVGGSHFVSLSHAWSSGPTNFLTERVLGIRPTGSGFATVDVDPELGNLAWAKGGVPTPRGVLSVRVDKTVAGQIIQVVLPLKTVAQVTVSREIAQLDGAPVKAKLIAPGKWILEVTSGTHTIQ